MTSEGEGEGHHAVLKEIDDRFDQLEMAVSILPDLEERIEALERLLKAGGALVPPRVSSHSGEHPKEHPNQALSDLANVLGLTEPEMDLKDFEGEEVTFASPSPEVQMAQLVEVEESKEVPSEEPEVPSEELEDNRGPQWGSGRKSPAKMAPKGDEDVTEPMTERTEDLQSAEPSNNEVVLEPKVVAGDEGFASVVAPEGDHLSADGHDGHNGHGHDDEAPRPRENRRTRKSIAVAVARSSQVDESILDQHPDQSTTPLESRPGIWCCSSALEH
ncbi:unnamed protein product [Durusdinium trenchii]|uniref:Uncharacterized protein n=1 Tax=Durusdinium trenchii TaxID=1381693 RepID=A0ABP0PFH1_9DINO